MTGSFSGFNHNGVLFTDHTFGIGDFDVVFVARGPDLGLNLGSGPSQVLPLILVPSSSLSGSGQPCTCPLVAILLACIEDFVGANDGVLGLFHPCPRTLQSGLQLQQHLTACILTPWHLLPRGLSCVAGMQVSHLRVEMMKSQCPVCQSPL